MDEDLARWVLEFLLRQATDDRFMNRILSILPLSNGDTRSKKTMLLKTMEFEVSNGSVSEKILETIETVVELDRKDGIAVSQSMKDAYCAVAVDCTVRFMKESCNHQGKYFDTVARIWRERIPNVERSEMADLVSDQLKNWKDDIEAAVWDSTVCENILTMNTRNDALKAVRVYVANAWKVMGPTFLELVAQGERESASVVQGMGNDRLNNQVGDGPSLLDARNLGIRNKPATNHVGKSSASLPNTGQEMGERNKVKIGEQATTSRQDFDGSINPAMKDKDQEERGATTFPKAGQGLGVVDESEMGDKDHAGKRVASPNAGEELGFSDRTTIRDKDQSGEQATASRQDLDIGVKSAITDEDRVQHAASTLPNVAQDLGASNITAMMEENQVGDRALGLPYAGRDMGVTDKPARRDKDIVGEREADWPNALAVREKSCSIETQKGNVLLKHRVVPGRAQPSRGGAKITDTEELSIKTSSSEYDSLRTPEVNKVQEALRSSSLELQAVVKDPLPDALRLAETVISDMKRKNMNHDSLVEHQDRMDVDASKTSVGESLEPVQANEGNIGNQRSVEEGVEPVQANNDLGNQCSRHENNVPRPSLMERNGTALTVEWDDSIDGSPERLPRRSNRPHLPSPKRKAVSPLKKSEITKFARRRKMKRWSVLEEDTLRTGVNTLGKGNWKQILSSNRDIFEERTEVDLKDKWRNMIR
ncbi:hypothetical protein L1049_014019 [Liquidambar formosana]|uniref:Uncharacterized protein n=1 Tax=Liquidambar formosana TaxID=63359 RepID=A0AAP0WXB1_LIQFO